MITAQLKASVILMTLFLTINIMAKALGLLQPLNPALQGFIEQCEGQSQLCWYGILLGTMRPDDAQPILEAIGYGNQGNYAPHAELCDLDIGVRPKTREISILRLVPCTNLRWGDVTSIFGFPDGTAYKERSFPLIVYGKIYLEIEEPNSPYAPVWAVTIWEAEKYYIGEMAKWHGFVSKWRLCQLEPDFIRC